MNAMYTLTIQTKFNFGDRVRFDSSLQQCAGEGTIYAVTLDGSGLLDYMITVDGRLDIQGGILEEEIVLIANDTKTMR